MLPITRPISATRSLAARSGQAACLVLATLALGGCRHGEDGPQVAGWLLTDPSQRHPIIVSQEPAHLTIHVARGSQGLSPGQRADVIGFARRFRASDAGNSRLVIAAPSGSSNEIAAMSAVEDVRELLLEGGFGETTIAVEAYHDESRNAPVRISYMRYVATGPQCGQDWSENLGRNPNNRPYANFGCTQQHNLAAMIANPADLVGPRSETPRAADRRDVVFNKWSKGQETAAEKTSEDGKVQTTGK